MGGARLKGTQKKDRNSYQDLQVFRHVKDFICLYVEISGMEGCWRDGGKEGEKSKKERMKKNNIVSGTDECAKQSMK